VEKHPTDKINGKQSWDSIVVGAGVFGGWTAWYLRRTGQRVFFAYFAHAGLRFHAHAGLQFHVMPGCVNWDGATVTEGRA
jgi:glycine/D-amino acid oxidase-like deaminating enzyme